MNPRWIGYLRQQGQVEAVEQNAVGILKNDSRKALAMMKCGQTGTYYNKGQSIVMADDYSFSAHLGIGSFSVYWRASCTIGPKKCCQEDEGSISGWSDKASYTCNIQYTLYDNYNFSYKTGTGASGVLKRMNPLGWSGTSFHQFGNYSEQFKGRRSIDTQPEERTKIKCCELLKGKK